MCWDAVNIRLSDIEDVSRCSIVIDERIIHDWSKDIRLRFSGPRGFKQTVKLDTPIKVSHYIENINELLGNWEDWNIEPFAFGFVPEDYSNPLFSYRGRIHLRTPPPHAVLEDPVSFLEAIKEVLAPFADTDYTPNSRETFYTITDSSGTRIELKRFEKSPWHQELELLVFGDRGEREKVVFRKPDEVEDYAALLQSLHASDLGRDYDISLRFGANRDGLVLGETLRNGGFYPALFSAYSDFRAPLIDWDTIAPKLVADLRATY